MAARPGRQNARWRAPRAGQAPNGGFDQNGNEGYWVEDPRLLYRGKSHSELVADWFNWFVSADADKRNLGPVVFLRSLSLPNRQTGAYISDVPGGGDTSSSTSDLMNADMVNYVKPYQNDPNIRIGGDRLRISADQAVFVPIIVAYWIKNEPGTDWGSMQEYTGLTLDHGDDPPVHNQLTINRNDVSLPGNLKMNDFRISSTIFPAVIPETGYGRSVKDFLEHPVSPGTAAAYVEGYFVLLTFDPGMYWVHSWSGAPREIKGPYFSELLYQIEVGPRRIGPGPRSLMRPPRNERIFDQVLSAKERDGDLTLREINSFQEYFANRKLDKTTYKKNRRLPL